MKRRKQSAGDSRQLTFAEPAQVKPPSEARPAAPYVFPRRSSPSPTVVFQTYWSFAAERQAVFWRRFTGEKAPWTTDPILGAYRFTNAYRASDRVSQYLIRNVIYDRERDFNETFLRVLIFKIFNRIETWELLVRKFGDVSSSTFSVEAFDECLTTAMSARVAIYSPAYIMPSGSRRRNARKHRTHLEIVDLMMRDALPRRLRDSPSMEAAFRLLLDYECIGPFLAYQYITDLNYSSHLDFTEMEFVVAGPGARDGIRKCFSDLGDWKEADVIRFAAETQEDQFARAGVKFRKLWGRPLQLIDCQNLFCEVDKYSRAIHPEFSGASGRTRIKQKFKSLPVPLSCWYPPKWGINELAAADAPRNLASSSYHTPLA